MTERADENGVIENLQSMVNKLTNDKHDLEEKQLKLIDDMYEIEMKRLGLKAGLEEILDVTVVAGNYTEALDIIRGIADHLVNGTER